MPANGGERIAKCFLLGWLTATARLRAVAARPAGHLSGFHPVEPHTPE